MAAPITHIVFAEKFRESISRLSGDEFIIGTSFPDIRYLGSIRREKTHKISIKKLDELENMQPFTAGMAFHRYLDDARSLYWNKQDLYDTLPKSPYLTHALKFFEDIILYDKIHHWREIGQYFDTILEAENSFRVPEEDVWAWHGLLKRDITTKPDLSTAPQFIISLGFGEEMAQSVHMLMEQLSRLEDIQEHIEGLYGKINGEISSANA